MVWPMFARICRELAGCTLDVSHHFVIDILTRHYALGNLEEGMNNIGQGFVLGLLSVLAGLTVYMELLHKILTCI